MRESIVREEKEVQVDEVELLGEPQLDQLALKDEDLSKANQQIEQLKTQIAQMVEE